MVSDAEKYKQDDEAQRDRINAKNALESYAFQMKSTVEDDKIKDKISEEDKVKIIEKCKETLDWLDSNQVGFWLCLVIIDSFNFKIPYIRFM